MARLKVYREQCPNAAVTDKFYTQLRAELIDITKMSEKEVDQMISGGALLVSAAATGDAEHNKFCADMKQVMDQVLPKFEARGSDGSRRLGNGIEIAIVAAIGAILGTAVGFAGRLVTGKNLNALRWWIPAWAVVAVGLSRVLLHGTH